MTQIASKFGMGSTSCSRHGSSTNTKGALISIAVGDVNHDDNLDLVVANRVGNSVSLLLGNGDGTFVHHSNYTVGSSPFAIVLADLNNDTHLDMCSGERP